MANTQTPIDTAAQYEPASTGKLRRVDLIDIVVLWTIGLVIFGLTFIALLGAEPAAAAAPGFTATGRPSASILAIALVAFGGMATLVGGMFRHLSRASRITWSDHWR